MKKKLQLAFIMVLTAPSPIIESLDPIVSSGLRGWKTGSAMLPAFLPMTIAPTYDNIIIATNNGNTDAETIIRLYGEPGGITSPRVTHIASGRTFQVNVTLTDDTKYIEIDSLTGSVVDQDGVDQSGHVDPTSEYILLSIGDNQLVYLSYESTGAGSPVNTWAFPQAVATVSHKDPLL